MSSTAEFAKGYLFQTVSLERGASINILSQSCEKVSCALSRGLPDTEWIVIAAHLP